MCIARCALTLAALSLLAGAPAGQATAPRSADDALGQAPGPLFSTVGLFDTDDGLAGAGPGYELRFGPAAVRFTPELGMSAPHDLPLAYRLVSVDRGTPVAIGAAAPAADATVVRYEHGSVTATYELRAHGVEQSFTFTCLPPGTGDLVVRGAISTELVPSAVDANGITFAMPGVGGVRIGAVFGIDARGARVRGEVRHHGSEIEYVLPAAFVDRAALPLVVDPLLSPFLFVSTGGFDRSPDIAYDATNDLYMVVFRYVTSATNQNIYAQRFTPAAFIGGLTGIETSTATLSSDPCVANIDASDGFVVAWHQNGDILARAIAADTGAITGTLGVATGSDVQTQPDIAGEAGPTQTAAVCVWANETTNDIQARHLIYNAGSLLVGLVVTTFANPVSSPYSAPSISQHHGASGRRMICWERFVSLGTANQAIVAVVVDRNLATVGGPLLLFNNSLDERDPDCDGDGDQWVIAFEREVTATSSDLYAVPVHRSGGTLVAGSEQPISLSSLDDVDPAVSWLQDACLVGWCQQASSGSSDYDSYLTSIEPLGCRLCEGVFPLRVATGSNESDVTMAWRLGNGSSDEAMVAWASNVAIVPFPGAPAIQALQFRSDDGSVTEVQAGCGTGGDLRMKCARAGALTSLSLFGASPNAATFLVLATSRIDYPCGPCVLVPDPFFGFIGSVTSTTAVGDTGALFALPLGLGGAAFYAQYITAGGSCFGGFSLSNAILVNVQ